MMDSGDSPKGPTPDHPQSKPDPVAAQYERWIYPAPVDDLRLTDFAAVDSRYRDLRELFFAYWPSENYREDLDILVAGCGTNAAASYAFLYPHARVTGIDVSGASLAHERHLQQKHRLANLTLHQLPIERAAELGMTFDLVVCHGVIHHLADPVAGMRSLAGLLRQQGVIALMVYAWHVRFGVYMLQDLFRLLDLRQDAESVTMVKETLGAVGRAHPVQQYLRRPNDLGDDTALVDTFLHPRDKPYTVSDCLELAAQAGLTLQGWDENGLYYPEGQVPPGSGLRARLDRLSGPDLWKAMELFSGNIPNHWFYACRQDRDPKTYRIQFDDDAFLKYIPVPRAQILPQTTAQGGPAVVISRHPYPAVRLDGGQGRLIQQIDRQRSVLACIQSAGITGDLRAVIEFARNLFKTLWRLGYMHFRLPSVMDHPSAPDVPTVPPISKFSSPVQSVPDPVAGQYERWIYPAAVDDLRLVNFAAADVRMRDLRELFFAYWPTWNYREDLDILVAGCGSMAAAAYAFLYPTARVTGIDISGASLAHERHLQQKHGLANLTLHQLPLERAAELGANYDIIVSHGVIHHLADPVAGLRTLAGILRPHGVIALMVYSWHAKFGVYMLQDLFRLLGLRQDAESIALVKETLGAVGHGHPVRQYLRLTNDLGADTGFVDTFLHVRDKPYTVADCLELVAGAGLALQGWDENGFYYPESQVSGGGKLRAGLDRLSTPDLWKAMELFNGNIPGHWFYACRRDRDPATYRIQFDDDAFLKYIPVPRAPILPQATAQGGQGVVMSRHPYPAVRLDGAQGRLLQQIDRQRSVEVCVQMAAITGDTRTVNELARNLFRTLWRLGYMHFRLPAGP